MKLRRRAVLKWTGAGLCALIFAAWLASWWFLAAMMHRQRSEARVVGVASGCLSFSQYYVSALPLPPGWSVSCRRRDAYEKWVWLWFPNYIRASTSPSEFMLEIPLSVPFAIIGIPTGWLFYRERQSVRPVGRCAKCGYNLSGLPPTAPCPECGRTAK